jgi:hypothetical protein
VTPKTTDQTASRSSTATTASSTTASMRKPWKKKTPVEVVLDQINKVREGVAEKEEELKQAKKQLQKLEEARNLLEST